MEVVAGEDGVVPDLELQPVEGSVSGTVRKEGETDHSDITVKLVGAGEKKAGRVTLKVYNILGQEVAELVSEKLSAGSYKYNWDARGLASGVYYYRLKTDHGFVQTKKMLLIR